MKKSGFVAVFGFFVGALPGWAQQIPQAMPAAPAALAAAVPTPVAAPAPAAQAKPAPAPAAAVPAQPAPPAPPQPPGSSRLSPDLTRNVRFDITITDTGGPKPQARTVSLTVAGGSANSVRNVARVPDPNPNPNPNPNPVSLNAVPVLTFELNVDVRAVNFVDGGGVRASVSIEYQPYVPDARVQPGMITTSTTTTFFDGRRTEILQSSDPLGDRRTTIEVTATLLK